MTNVEEPKKNRGTGRGVKRAAMIPFIVMALFFGYENVSKRLEELEDRKMLQQAQRNVASYLKKKKDAESLKRDIIKAFSGTKDELAYNRVLFAITTNLSIYKSTVAEMARDGDTDTAFRAALLYCNNLNTFDKPGSGDTQSIAKCFERFGFDTSMENDKMTINVKGSKK